MTTAIRATEGRPNRPTDSEVDEQLQRIRKSPYFLGAAKRFGFLEYLVQAQRKGRFKTPFSSAKPNPIGKRIFYEFELEWTKNHGQPQPKDEDYSEPQGKKAIKTLRESLTSFNDASTGPIKIDIPKSSVGYEPEITYWSGLLIELPAQIKVHASRPIICEVIESEHDARGYLMERLRLSKMTAPKIVSIRELHSRPKTRFGGATDRSSFIDTLKDALRSASKDAVIVTVIFGQMIDPIYAAALSEARDGSPNLECLRLRTSDARMDFTLIDFNDGSSVVLFGGGQGSSASSGTIFRSAEDPLTGEFDQLFETALQNSDHVPVQALLESRHEDENTAIKLEPKWNQGRFEELVKSVNPDPKRGPSEEQGDLCICTTFFVGDTPLRSKLIEALGRGVRIQVLMLDPDNEAMLEARFRLRTDTYSPDNAKRDLLKHIKMLEDLEAYIAPSVSPKGSVEIRVSNKMPSGFVAHSRDWAVMGIMLARESYAEGPMIEVMSSRSSLWRHIEADWHVRWNDPDNKLVNPAKAEH